MARFKYVAKDMSGKVHKGTVAAASENALTRRFTGKRTSIWLKRKI